MYPPQIVDYRKHGVAPVLVMVNAIEQYMTSRKLEVQARKDTMNDVVVIDAMRDIITLTRYSDDLLSIWSINDLKPAHQSFMEKPDMRRVIEGGVFFAWSFVTPEVLKTVINALVDSEIASRCPQQLNPLEARSRLIDIYQQNSWLVFCQLVRLARFDEQLTEGDVDEATPPL